MRGLGRRLDRLAAAPRRPRPAPGPAFDAARLSAAERAELDGLLGPLAPLPSERWNLAPLSDGQLDRACELVAKGHGDGEGPA